MKQLQQNEKSSSKQKNVGSYFTAAVRRGKEPKVTQAISIAVNHDKKANIFIIIR